MDHLSEIHEQILIRLSVRDLIRCKSVCKSWLSLISKPQFIKAHLNQNDQIDRKNDIIGHRRIVMSKLPYNSDGAFEFDNYTFDFCRSHLLGSANGLVCVSLSRTEIVIVNPSTREVNKITKPQIPAETGPLFWGFGHDSYVDDYKAVIGYLKDENCTCFQVFSLKANTWKMIEEVNHAFSSRIGVLCKGALHWVAYDNSSKKNIVLSFSLLDEKFVEVPQPDDVRYQYDVAQEFLMRLGTMKDCLCVFLHESLLDELWVMKEYNVKESWEIIGREPEVKYDFLHRMKLLQNYVPNKGTLSRDIGLSDGRLFMGSPLFVESLVSPHFHKRQKRKRRQAIQKLLL
uniref:F-box protein CPR1-like n=1 Tax=Erigeron canadensis TaxID=72917 RepID=UPI001CB8F1AF|nr:F-box protein CPR1-like [Erigeron canadensis]